jgi:hypothetical protein
MFGDNVHWTVSRSLMTGWNRWTQGVRSPGQVSPLEAGPFSNPL